MEFAGQPDRILSAKELGLVSCTRCAQVWPEGTEHCGRCGHRLSQRDAHSLQKVWAFWIVGIMAYIPANLYPMLQTRTLFFVQENTIIGGAVELIEYGSWVVALIILFASVAIPIGKFVAIAYLAISVQYRSTASYRQRHILYEVVDYIGRWSMIDIFVVAIMSSLVQLNTLAAVNPGKASLYFALSVIFTMLSAQAFDSRLIWDAQAQEEGTSRND
ncbi:paraquat-inducible protein A [Sulfitobacter sp. D35]|uniref:paraquat-inducible protein A n=1 Tax=Sulfitobacter sp. D35 TaxID=3083252 RepID=UPI00296E4CA6|nr:paraquat-inducible protein A [Sulfitobacter sp. D35]MDW4499291.1 paraquat-inducible protein A [Sulfitobacter sp. D35]